MKNYLSFLILPLLFLISCRQTEPIRPTPTPLPIILVPPSESSEETLLALTTAEIPPRDLADLAQRLRGIENIPTAVHTTAQPYEVGDSEQFWFKNHATNEVVQIEATLQYRSDQLNLWFESGTALNESALQTASNLLETKILPTNRAFFGQESSPGVDGDPRFNILHLKEIGGNIAGYFSQADEFSQLVNPYSNEREMLYVSLRFAPVGSPKYYSLVAHEMQHMIHWETDKNEEIWLNEGLSELASYINGYGESDFVPSYLNNPDIQLNNFDYEAPGSPHYGASFLFNAYLLNRLGDDQLKQIIQNPKNGPEAIEETTGISFNSLFTDWLITNYLHSSNLSHPPYQYDENLSFTKQIKIDQTPTSFPFAQTTSVSQYGVDYIRLTHDTPLTFAFTGTQQIRLLNTMPLAGNYFWSAYPAADNSDMHLTHSFDLSALDQATLNFSTWYDIEEGWDYVYVLVSPDNGNSWIPQQTKFSTQADPQGNSYGHALTATSGGQAEPIWVDDTVDLTPYAGQKILLRFEYITDDAFHLEGIALDNIAIPELNFLADAESDNHDWSAAGFIRHTNLLPQTFSIQLLTIQQNNEISVTAINLESDQTALTTIPFSDTIREQILIISGITPVTSQSATYQYQLR